MTEQNQKQLGNTLWTCPVSTDGLKFLDLLGIFNQIDLTVAVN